MDFLRIMVTTKYLAIKNVYTDQSLIESIEKLKQRLTKYVRNISQ